MRRPSDPAPVTRHPDAYHLHSLNQKELRRLPSISKRVRRVLREPQKFSAIEIEWAESEVDRIRLVVRAAKVAKMRGG